MTSAIGGLTRFGRYGGVGVGTNLGLYALFLLLVWAGLSPVPVSGLCYVLGVAMSYLLNRRWTFASRGSHQQDLPRFMIAYGVGLIVTLVSMRLLILPLGPELAQLTTISITAATIFVALILLRFGRTD